MKIEIIPLRLIAIYSVAFCFFPPARQENRMLQTKYAAMESKSKELAMQQSASVSGATAALSGLHARLDNLVEQLVFSYNISEQDLEVSVDK